MVVSLPFVWGVVVECNVWNHPVAALAPNRRLCEGSEDDDDEASRYAEGRVCRLKFLKI